jgi:hypothetical protein
MSAPHSTPPPTIKELIEGATPGPWQVVHRHPDPETAKGYAEILGPDQCGACGPGFTVAIADIYNMSGKIEQANAQLIARCSPDVMRVVVEALEAAKERAGQHRMTHYYETGGTTPCADEPLQAKLFRALSLLNATAKPEGKK